MLLRPTTNRLIFQVYFLIKSFISEFTNVQSYYGIKSDSKQMNYSFLEKSIKERIEPTRIRILTKLTIFSTLLLIKFISAIVKRENILIPARIKLILPILFISEFTNVQS